MSPELLEVLAEREELERWAEAHTESTEQEAEEGSES